MALLLILLGLVFVMIILRLMTTKHVNIEMFQGTTSMEIDPKVAQEYDAFIKFFNQFQTNWEKAVVSSIASDTPQQPLTSPSQVQSSQTPPEPSESEKAEYVKTLSAKEGTVFPQILPPLPNTLTPTNIQQVIQQIPTDTTPYSNALEYMNNNLMKAHANLGSALQGGSLTEGFQESCSDVTQCIQNNPTLIAQIGQAAATAAAQQFSQNLQSQEAQLLQKLQNFTKNTQLSDQIKQNQQLVEKSQDIQNQAQSGALINSINVPGGNTVAKYDLPPGADTLKQMQQNDPERYKQLKNNFSNWASLKELLEQINSNL
jgi:hypothetical protein